MQCFNLSTTFFSNALSKFSAWSGKLAALTSCSAFSLQPQVTVYISGSVMIHLLGSNTKSTEFQPNFTGFKLDSGTNIRFEKIKTKECDLRMYPCDISEVGGKDYNALFSFV